jgi:hypothetical protein
MVAALRAEVASRLQAGTWPAERAPTTLWSLAVTGALTREVWDGCVAVLQEGGAPYEALPSEALSQVHQAWMLAAARQGGAGWPADEALLARARATWTEATAHVT